MAQATHNQMNNLTTLIKRLEAATSRLEDLATVVPSLDQNNAVVQQNSQSQAAPAAAPAEPLPQSIEDFDELIQNDVAKYIKLSEEIGDLVEKQSKSVAKCFDEQRKFLLITTKAKKPDNSSQLFMDLLAGMQEHMTAVSNIRESNRHSPYMNHLSCVSEGAPSLAWVTYEAKPANFVSEMIGSAKFYGNRVLTEYKAKGEQKHMDWVNSYYNLLSALEAYVKRHHQTGVTWNAKGQDAKEVLAQVSVSDSKPAAGPPIGSGAAAPPPPPPPPPPGYFENIAKEKEAAQKAAGGDITDMFAEINRGADVTAGLKKVDRSQMTHKNPEIRGGSLVPARPSSSGSVRGKSPAPPSQPKPAHLTKKKPPKMELDGNKWIVENYENESNLVITDTEISQSVFISRCKNTTIQIKGKVNMISINECTKTQVLAESLVSSVDIIRSNSFALQVLQKVPTIQADQCDGGTIYIPKDSMNVEIFTSKCTALNVCVPEAGEDGDFAERAVPEQIKHTIKDGQLVSEIVEHAG